MVRLSNQFLEDLEKVAAIYRDLAVDNIQAKESENLDQYDYQKEMQKEITNKKRGQRP